MRLADRGAPLNRRRLPQGSPAAHYHIARPFALGLASPPLLLEFPLHLLKLSDSLRRRRWGWQGHVFVKSVLLHQGLSESGQRGSDRGRAPAAES